MQYRSLGRTGVRVSEICLGTMMFGARTDRNESIKMIDHALDVGVNFVDTANVYGANESERIVGEALARHGKRDATVLATKFNGPQGDDVNSRGLSRRHVIEACEASLRRLQTEWIDLYQLHRPSAEIPIDETLRALDDLIHAGKIRYIGTSMFAGWKLVESLWVAKELGLNRFVCEQPAYHMLDRTAEREVIPAAETFGIGIIPWGPLCGGLLTGKYDRHGGDVGGRWKNGSDNFGRHATDAAWDAIDLVKEIAREKGASPSQVALAWCGAQPGVTAPIIGPRTFDQLTDNLGAVEVTLSAEDLARVDAVVPPRGVAVRYYDEAAGLDLRPNLSRAP